MGHGNPHPPQAIVEKLVDDEKKMHYKTQNNPLNKLLIKERKHRLHIRLKEKAKKKRRSLQRKPTKEKSTKRKFDINNVTEEDYMDFYIHFLSPDQDTALVKHVRSFIDLTKLRKQMNLGDEPTPADVEIIKLLLEDDLAEIKNPFERRLLRGKLNPLSTDCRISVGDMAKVKDIVRSHIEKITDPKLLRLYHKFGVTPLEVCPSTDSLSTVDSLATTEYDSANEEEDDKIEQGLLRLIRGSMTNVLKDLRTGMGTFADDDDDDWTGGEELEGSSDSESSNKSLVQGDQPQPLEVCNQYDFDCMSAHGFLGPHPFGGSKPKGSQSGRVNSEDGIKANDSDNTVGNLNVGSIFNVDHWKGNDT